MYLFSYFKSFISSRIDFNAYEIKVFKDQCYSLWCNVKHSVSQCVSATRPWIFYLIILYFNLFVN